MAGEPTLRDRLVLTMPEASSFILRCARCGRFLVAAGLLLLCLTGPGVRAASGPTGLYGGSDSVLHLVAGGDESTFEGVLYSRAGAFRFSGRRTGETIRARKIYSRNDRNAPWRLYHGALSIQVRHRGAKLGLSLTGTAGPRSAVFRRRVSAREALGALDRYGETFCDGEHVVLLVFDPAPPSSAGWLRRLVGREREALPPVGFYFGPRTWYYFEGRGGPEAGVDSVTLFPGSGRSGTSPAGLRIRAVREGGQLAYHEIRMGTEHRLSLPYSAQRSACSRLLTRWTVKRRMPRGSVVRKGLEKPAKKTGERAAASKRARRTTRPKAAPKIPAAQIEKKPEKTAPESAVAVPEGAEPKRAGEALPEEAIPAADAEPIGDAADESVPDLDAATVPADHEAEAFPEDSWPEEAVPPAEGSVEEAIDEETVVPEAAMPFEDSYEEPAEGLEGEPVPGEEKY